MMLRNASSEIGAAPSRLRSSPKANLAIVMYGCLASCKPSAQRTNKYSRRACSSSTGASQEMRWLHVPWSIRHGNTPRAYSFAKREPPRLPKAEAFFTPSNLAAQNLVAIPAAGVPEDTLTADTEEARL